MAENNDSEKRIAISRLKANWISDPCWDIEDSEGFEEFHDELLQFRLQHEKNLSDQWDKKMKDYGEKFGCTDIKLAEKLWFMEEKIERLQDKLDIIRNR